MLLTLQQVAAWLRGNALVSINKVTLRWAWVVLGRVTISRPVYHLSCDQSLRPIHPFTLSGTEYDYWPKCDDALWLGSKDSQLADKCVGGR